ncbi:MAG: HIT family protein [bacterium]|nr:HIT family protein [bacterium]
MDAAQSENIFVRILRGELPSHEIYSNSDTCAFLDINPHAPGHTLVVPRLFSEHIMEASDADIAACMRTVRRIIPALIGATGAAGVTVLSNMGREAGQMIPYLHFHVIPRAAGSKLSGEIGASADQDELAAMAQKIRAELER